MKPVLLTFIGIVLVYSLMFNDKKSTMPAEKINYLYENTSPMLLMPDSSFRNTNFRTPDLEAKIQFLQPHTFRILSSKALKAAFAPSPIEMIICL
ncbi:MAG: hypothetical protein LBN11_00455 [Tannerella sp.]|jgi:hypothetical protein|nr:hypothetical protein [Tannerella sp.]